MCQSIAEGGQRCAAHTRPKFESAAWGSAEWVDAASAYAATQEGSDRLSTLLDKANQNGQVEDSVMIASALEAGELQREMARELRTRIQDAQASADLPPDRVVGQGIHARKEWRQDGELHRLGGPAIAGPDTHEEWYLHGQRHRIGGPAATYTDGTQKYYVRGQLHRTDGPAVTRRDGSQEWWAHGRIHRDGGPAVVTDGLEEWYSNGLRHREDGPATTYSDGKQIWYRNGNIHRTDGPAVIDADGTETWLHDGREVAPGTPYTG